MNRVSNRTVDFSCISFLILFSSLCAANHLDLHAILWLQEYLVNETEGRTVVVVSHDREFLDAVTEETIIFRDKKLKYHAGNYEDYERNTEEQRIRKQALLDVSESTE